MKKKFKPITYDHDIIYYVPCYQVKETNSIYSTFTYSIAEATSDEQLARSLDPDYVLKLEGHFHAVTKQEKRKKK
jgi:hypothetical protein